LTRRVPGNVLRVLVALAALALAALALAALALAALALAVRLWVALG
jgi:hypothetical protein